MRSMMTLMVLWFVVAPLSAQTPDLTPNPGYRLLAATKTSTLQAELSQLAGQGFRVIAGAPTNGAEMVLFLELVAHPPSTYAYRLLATTKTSTMQKELADSAREGFRLIPQATIAKDSPGGKLVGGPREIVAVMERAPQSDKRYEYRLLATSKTATLQREVSEAVAAGFVLVGTISRGEHMVVMEKELRD